jgi:hypothetical protein
MQQLISLTDMTGGVMSRHRKARDDVQLGQHQD